MMPEGKDRLPRKNMNKNRTFALTEGDQRLLQWGAAYLGTTQSDLMRTALRAYVMHLEALAR
jgi:hypothetical protein